MVPRISTSRPTNAPYSGESQLTVPRDAMKPGIHRSSGKVTAVADVPSAHWRLLFSQSKSEFEGDLTRPVRAALVPQGFPDAEVGLRFGGLMTVVVGGREDDDAWVAAAHAVGQEEPPHEFRAPARTLSSILDEVGAPEVDFLSLDVEGYEAQVLAGLDLERHAPRFVLVEIRDANGGLAPIEAMLGERYVDVAALSPFDILYGRADVARSAELPARPGP